MKYLLLTLVMASFISCGSSEKKKSDTPAAENVKNEDFVKEKSLKNSEVTDYYAGNPQALSPALQDETIDRYSAQELAQMTESADPLMEIALRCSKNDFKNAFAVASRVFNRYQKVAIYWNLVANCHLNEGSQRKALLFYNKALEVQSNFIPALNNIGVMYSRMGQDQKALVAFEKAHKMSKFAKTPRYNLAKLYLTYGLADLALPIFQGLASDAAGDIDLLNAIAAAHFLKGDYQSALANYKKIPQDQWGKAEIGLNLALTLKKLNQKDQAMQVFELVDKPKSSNLKRYYASVRKHLGDKE